MQEFTIKQGATQPVLVMKVNRYNNFSYEKFERGLENCAITFSMVDEETGIYVVTKRPGGLILKTQYVDDNIVPSNMYYIYYKFTKHDTNKIGRYRAEFKIDFFDVEPTDITGTFIGPIHNDLYVNVRKSLFTNFNNNNHINDDDSGIFTDVFNPTFD